MRLILDGGLQKDETVLPEWLPKCRGDDQRSPPESIRPCPAQVRRDAGRGGKARHLGVFSKQLMHLRHPIIQLLHCLRTIIVFVEANASLPEGNQLRGARHEPAARPGLLNLLSLQYESEPRRLCWQAEFRLISGYLGQPSAFD